MGLLRPILKIDTTLSSATLTEEVTAKLSEHLPNMIDKMTPDGVIPEGGLLGKGLEFLKGKFS